MKYFLDTEFIEGFHKPLFGKRRHFIDLISIGIVCEDGREYYAISNEWEYKKADMWVKENIIHKLPLRLGRESIGEFKTRCRLPDTYTGDWHDGKSNNKIAEEVRRFFCCWRDQHFWRAPEDIEVYGYFADYDWVLLCSLFGRMIDLPKGFPMYCRDLKQMMDDQVSGYLFSKRLHFDILGTTIHQLTLEEKLKKVKAHPDYPKQQNEHNALADAKWNYELYKFLTK